MTKDLRAPGHLHSRNTVGKKLFRPRGDREGRGERERGEEE
jgi:hypothetical protein